LKGYDYTGEWLFFVAIFIKDRQRCFGKISTGKMILNDNRKIFCGIGLMNYGTRNVNIMIPDDGIMHGVGTCHGMSLHATNEGIAGTRHGVSPPPGVSKTSIQSGKPVSGSVSVIINQSKQP
jgi:hypothetical protein